MDIGDIFKFLAEDIHTVIAATADDEGMPVTCTIDVMDYDGGGLYFLTAKGKGFYRRLMSRGYAALTGIKGRTPCTAPPLRCAEKSAPKASKSSPL